LLENLLRTNSIYLYTIRELVDREENSLKEIERNVHDWNRTKNEGGDVALKISQVSS
jgi:hypothetical protein